MFRKSVVLYLPDLSGGGAERLQINLAYYLLGQGMEVTFVLDRAEGLLLAQVPQGAKLVHLGSRRVAQSLLKLRRYLREKRPDYFLSNLSHNNLIALWAHKLACVPTKIIVVQHRVLSVEAQQLGRKFRVLPFLYRLFLPWADGVVAVSHGMAEDMARLTQLPLANITTIYNGVITADFDAKAAAPVTHPWFAQDIPVFVAVGRLVEQKDFATLLRALAQVNARRPARLVILGEGPLRPALTTLASELGLVAQVDLVGFQTNPLPCMRAAAAVVLSSTYEGFAIVLAEALACGTPVVSTDCKNGPAEVLEGGRYGKLVPVGDAAAMAAAMLDVLAEKPDAAFLSARGRFFSMQACGDAYIALFKSLG